MAVTSVRVPAKIRNCSTTAKKIRSEVVNHGKLTEVIYVRLTANGARLAGQSVVLDPGVTARVTFDVYPKVLTLGAAEICVEAIIQQTDLTPPDNKLCSTATVVGCQ